MILRTYFLIINNNRKVIAETFASFNSLHPEKDSNKLDYCAIHQLVTNYNSNITVTIIQYLPCHYLPSTFSIIGWIGI